MKLRIREFLRAVPFQPFIIAAGLIFTSGSCIVAQQQNSAEAQAQSAALEAQFYAIYTDLFPHKDIVNAAIQALQAEGHRPKSVSDYFQTIARKARTNLQLSRNETANVAGVNGSEFAERKNGSRREAQRLFPEVSQPSSPIYRRVGEERQILARICSSYFQDPNWPLILTKQCIALMALETQEKQARPAQSSTGSSFSDMKEMLDFLKQLEDFSNRRR